MVVRFLLLWSGLTSSFLAFSQYNFNRHDSLRGSLNSFRSCFDVHYYDLNISIDITQKNISGYNTIHFRTTALTNKIQLDLFRNMRIDSVCFNSEKLLFDRDSNAFFVQFPETLPSLTNHALTVYYHGEPIIAKKAPWDGGWVFTKDSLRRPWVGVACEGIGASLWWPLKDHLSDEPDSMRMTYTIPASLIAIGNGNLESIDSSSASLKSYTWKVNNPINSYNVTCNIAHYDHIKESHIQLNKDTLAIDYYILDYNKSKALKHFKQVHPMLNCYEHYFGPYPFAKDGFAMVETPYWGMEHQGAIAYGNNYANRIIFDTIVMDYIIIHETAHEWWGNNVSTSDHADMWIHESFATYTENLWVEYLYGYNMSVRYLNLNKSRIKNKESIIGPKDVNYNNWQGSDMYYKGAWILHSFRNMLQNDTLWFNILKGIQQEFALKTTSTESIIEYINTKTGSDYTWFFKQYLYQAEPPVLLWFYEKKKGKIYLAYKWGNVNPDFKMPIYLYLCSGNKIKVTPTAEYQRTKYGKQQKNGELFDINSNYYLTKQIKKL